MKIIGLTGGIGMGKSTAANAFRRAHLPVFDADAEVHRLQQKGGRAVTPLAQAFPTALENGSISRKTLRTLAIQNPTAMATLEKILHPLVRAAERRFLARARAARSPAAILDIPLLLENHGQSRVNLVLVVTAPPAIQRARVRRRRQMTQAQIEAILARQMPDREKRRHADILVHTGLSRYHANRTLQRLIRSLRPSPPHSQPGPSSSTRKRQASTP